MGGAGAMRWSVVAGVLVMGITVASTAAAAKRAKPYKKTDGARVATAEQSTPLDQFVGDQKGCEGGWKVLDGQRFVLDWPKSGFDGALLAVARCAAGAGKFGVGVRLLDGTSSFTTELAVNQWSPDAVQAVLVRDVNGDNTPDVVIAATAMTGVGPTGAQPFAVMDALVSTPETSSSAAYRAASEAERKAMERAKTAKAAGVLLAAAIRRAGKAAPSKSKARTKR
ncbi:MAG: hypothetical protein H6747_14650 [Deltaproteobacteria bacterium]|nr:hypothetical protein [Deltaproteobacteria bacterium]